MKRSLDDLDPEIAAKKQRTNELGYQNCLVHDQDSSVYISVGSSRRSSSASACSSPANEENTLSASTILSTTSHVQRPLTAPSTISPASRKSPSDLKTIPCTHPGCGKTFNRPARLAAHLRSHNNDRPFKCTFPSCAKDYLEEKHLKQHIKGSHSQERKHVCPVDGCGKSFLTATRLRRHAAVHEGAERFKCTQCHQNFRKHQTLQRHIRTAHLGQAAFLCDYNGCGAGFDNAGALRRHADREHGEVRFWCDECASSGTGARVGFTAMMLLRAHVRKEHVNCIFCDVRCGGRADLERHVELYHSGSTVEDRKTVECTWPSCNKKFVKRANLNAHIKTAHEGFRFTCGQVDTFGTPDIANWNWIEEGCGATFISKMKLEEHVRYVHLGMKRPPRLYDVRESTAANLIDEISGVTESNKRSIVCTVSGCQARFMRHHDLEVHVQSEHGEGLLFSEIVSSDASSPSPSAQKALELPHISPDTLELAHGPVATYLGMSLASLVAYDAVAVGARVESSQYASIPLESPSDVVHAASPVEYPHPNAPWHLADSGAAGMPEAWHLEDWERVEALVDHEFQ